MVCPIMQSRHGRLQAKASQRTRRLLRRACRICATAPLKESVMLRAILLCTTLFFSYAAQAQFGDIFKSKSTAPGLSDTKIAAGLKEALQVGATNAVALTGKPDGYLKNDAIHIPLPDKLKAVGKGMRMLGMGAQLDQLEVGMNRAAEQA